METARLFVGKSEARHKAKVYSKIYQWVFFVYYNLAGHYAVDSQAGENSDEVLDSIFVNGKEQKNKTNYGNGNVS